MLTRWQMFAGGAMLAGAVALFASCGSDDKKDDDNTSTGTLTFTTDIAPIVKESCTGAGCHGKVTASSTVYEDNETNFKAAKETIKTRLNLESGTLKMPKAADDNGVAKSISADNKSKILNFLAQ